MLKRTIDYSIIQTEKELKEASNLVYQEYLRQGYINPETTLEEISVYGRFPGATVFAAKYENKIIGTISVIADSELGLPIDDIYKEEVDDLRRLNKKIAQVSSLAISRTICKNSKKRLYKEQTNELFIFFPLFKLVFHYALYKEYDNLCIVINPKHNYFYTSLFFNDLGEIKFYPALNNAPALAKSLNINQWKNKKILNRVMNNIINKSPDYKIFKE